MDLDPICNLFIDIRKMNVLNLINENIDITYKYNDGNFVEIWLKIIEEKELNWKEKDRQKSKKETSILYYKILQKTSETLENNFLLFRHLFKDVKKGLSDPTNKRRHIENNLISQNDNHFNLPHPGRLRRY